MTSTPGSRPVLWVLAVLAAAGCAAPRQDLTARGSSPHVAVGPDGAFAVVQALDDEIRARTWGPDGRAEGPERRVGAAGRLARGSQWGPKVAWTRGALVVTATCGETLRGLDGDVYAWRSVDRGDSWTGPVRVNAADGAAREGMHDLAAAPDGRLLCVWLDSSGPGVELHGAWSRDGGASWGDEQVVARSPDGTICECCHPTADFEPGGAAVVMFRNALGGDRDLWLAREDGAGWSGSPVGHAPWPLSGCPVAGGDLAIAPDGARRIVYRLGSELQALGGAPVPARLTDRGRTPRTAFGPDGFVMAWMDVQGRIVVRREIDPAGPPAVLGPGQGLWLAGAPDGRGPLVAVYERTDDVPDPITIRLLSPRRP